MNNQQLADKLNRHLSFLDQDENNLTLLVEISDLYMELDDFESAQSYLDKAKIINHKACLGHQGLLHLNQGKFSQAQECFLEALNHLETPALRYNLGFTYFITFDFEKAWEVLAPLLEGEHYPEAELLMARILHRQDSIEEAIGLVENILEHNPDDAEALGCLSLLYFDLNEDALANETSLRALKINPENYDAKLVNMLIRLITHETTIEEIEELLQINPQDSRLWFALGNTYMTQGDLDSAESTLQKAVEIYPEFYDCHIALAWCQLLNDHVNEAHETYQDAVELVDELADGWGGLALVYALNEDFIKAEQLINKANDLNPDCFLTEIAQTICFNYKNPQKGKEHLVNTLRNSGIPISEKLAVFIEELQGQQQLH
ncbi:tetratricopeptide repeat protein [Legionella maioricensis]|uniref:Tetratricopeptide repeat protein n=1 Tax=Legionella maioricensis TaxID=2896528 RepID=A0A9X2IAM6_9GAMM|nr:tetratricopeptide repeat protein [Legionella maioricensis]MCL9682672.1 tetratricopeptide repeat protein [Legionella maioricensis]MCL9687281.1 tetratricopeptide repeat protein [Legionella maioricensis]